MSGHTPGPWAVTPSSHRREWCAWIDGTGDDRTVAGVTDGPHGDANAHLIAAAPDLLAACEAAFDLISSAYENLTTGDVEDSAAREHGMLTAAIRRARGES